MSHDLSVPFGVAERFLADGMLREAAMAYQALLDRHPGHPGALRGLALVAEANDDLVSAIDSIQQAISHLPAPETADMLVDLARFLHKQGRADDAIALVMAATGHMAEAERWEDAIALTRRIWRIHPDDPGLRVRLVYLLHSYSLKLQDSNRDYALELELEAVDLNPNHYAILRELARMYSIGGQLDEARPYLDRLIQIFDDQAPPAEAPQGLLDIALADATPEIIARALLSDGAVLIRGLLDKPGQDHYLSLVEKRWLFDEQEIVAHVSPKILDAMAIILGRRAEAMTPGSNVRTAQIEDDQSFLHYHQDLTPLYTMGINFWAALDPIDGTRPGLEILVRRQHKAFPVAAGHITHTTGYRIPDALVRGVYPEQDFVAPRMAAGDGMMFLFSTIHRSHVLPEMTLPRRNAELRFT